MLISDWSSDVFSSDLGLVPFFLGLVDDIDAGLLAPEQVGAERDITLGGEAVADVAHHLVDAKDFLDDEDARSPLGRSLACGRLGQIAGEAAAVMGLDVDAAGHGILLFAYTMPDRKSKRLNSSP